MKRRLEDLPMGNKSTLTLGVAWCCVGNKSTLTLGVESTLTLGAAADPTQDGIQYAYDDLNNVVVDADRNEPNRSDYLNDSAGNDLIQAGGGNDVVTATRGGDDRIDGGNGNDQLAAGAGKDVILGGAGSDILNGGADNDRLYGNVEIELALAIEQGRTDVGTGIKGDWLNGVAGDDIIVGTAHNDALFGGGGDDVLVGGAGDDYMDGDAANQDWHSNSSAGAASKPKVAGNARQCLSLAFLSNQNAPQKRSAPADAANELHYARAA